eukprot:TRINITY_DN5431_c0_g3_i1.p1 TRINITY_DN5431_c0_g3~~TRINITY_DN5431_c0_g3_i1.p1  ORF type:complete len:187 (+),score=58.66 TRINITY_DN5431_c0_g3_i1:111-671(+)
MGGNASIPARTRVILLGLDSAGKTTILYKINKADEVVTTIPTIGFCVEEGRTDNHDFWAWDVGGEDKIRPLWRHYYESARGLAFVLDANDRERLEEAREELFQILREQDLRSVPLVIFANKQDLENAMAVEEVHGALRVEEISASRHVHVIGCCATSGNGVQEGLEWLKEAMALPAPVTCGESETK